MNLVIDVGNTRFKYAFFEGEQLTEAKFQADDLWTDLQKWKQRKGVIDILLSGSGDISEEVRNRLKEMADFWQEASSLMPLPLQIGYDTPSTLGFDRIAICTGAMGLHPGKPLLVIDSGTCITFNYVDANGNFLGGNISPGLEMRLRSLQQYTAKLPYVPPAEDYGGIGKNTGQAIRNGVMSGILFEVESYIRRFRQENPAGEVIITGGNSRYLQKYLGNGILYNPVLSLMGLNHILLFAKKIN